MQRYMSVYLWKDTRERLEEILSCDGLTLNKVLNAGVLVLTDEQLRNIAQDTRFMRPSRRKYTESNIGD